LSLSVKVEKCAYLMKVRVIEWGFFPHIYGLGVLVFSLGERFVFVKRTSVKSGMLWVWCALEEAEEEEPRNEVRLENETERAFRNSSHART
jgi:hypothetical protein